MLRNNPTTSSPIERLTRTIGCRFALILLLAVAGCAGPLRLNRPSAADSSLNRYLLTTVPFFPQEAYQCGPASLAMLLAWSGVEVSPEDLAAEVYTPSRKGSLQPAIIAAARRHDRITVELSDARQLGNEIAAGHPVLVLLNLGLQWYPVWHYAVVIGIDFDDESVILHSGTSPQKRMPWKTFAYTWARSDFWGLLVLPPTQLPAATTENDYLTALGHIERLGRWQTAAQGYRTALQRWPRSLAATVGLGACLYQTGDLESAEAVLRTATLTFPDQGVIYNNLAQVLIDQGRKNEAIQAALEAVELGGPLRAEFQETLEEIRSR